MRQRKGLLRIYRLVFIPVLFLVILILFRWYSGENTKRIEDQNRSYAADSARQIANHVEDELSNGLSRIRTYADFLGKSLSQPKVTAEMLSEMEENSNFDGFRFVDAKGLNHAADGQTSIATDRDYYLNGMKGESGFPLFLSPGSPMSLWWDFILPYISKGILSAYSGGCIGRRSICRICFPSAILVAMRECFFVHWMESSLPVPGDSVIMAIWRKVC